jgi:hypothetical protein
MAEICCASVGAFEGACDVSGRGKLQHASACADACGAQCLYVSRLKEQAGQADGTVRLPCDRTVVGQAEDGCPARRTRRRFSGELWAGTTHACMWDC